MTCLALGKRIAELRAIKDITQADLSRVLGVSRTTVAMWETEHREPDAATLDKLASFFAVSVDYLLGRTDDPTPPSDEDLTPEEYDRRVVAALSRSDGYGEPLTKEEIDDILKYIRWTREKHRMEKEKKSDS